MVSWLGLSLCGLVAAPALPPLRPPAVPLVACDPYFSIWSLADKLTDADTTHWTGKPHRLVGLVRIDGVPYRLIGRAPAAVPALPQISTRVFPTRTICTFEGAGVRLRLTFLTPALPDDLMVYSRPVTYVEWDVERADAQDHSVQIYLEASTEIAVNLPSQPVAWEDRSQRNLAVLRVGSAQQPVLQKKGDDLRVDWGYLHLAALKSYGPSSAVSEPLAVRGGFLGDGRLNGSPPGGSAPSASPVLAMSMNLGRISAEPVRRFFILAYDDEFSIQHFQENLRPYWRRNGDNAAGLLEKSAAEFDALKARCEQFDSELNADLTQAGGDAYAAICTLAYRQCVAGNKLVADAKGRPLLFPKENFSNGCIGTVDVLYPMAPQFLLLSPALTRAMLLPLMDYAASPRWKFDFAPHDLGTYPLANGQVYGGGERTKENQMPVEETGNLLILLAALAQIEGNADFSSPYWPVLQKWAAYLEARGFDPENQLCTDDFAGHLAHNVNLSAKAICGLGAYAKLCQARGNLPEAERFRTLAKSFAQRWVQQADDGRHFRLAFDKPGSWSQKYNLVWDRLLDLGLFPDSVLRKEIDAYKARQNRYGLPLDNRKDYTKLDWTLWTACLTRDRADFEALVLPVFRFLQETPDRVPMTDWYDTRTGRKSGFQARPVVGGVFLQVLYNRDVWKKWADRGRSLGRSG